MIKEAQKRRSGFIAELRNQHGLGLLKMTLLILKKIPETFRVVDEWILTQPPKPTQSLYYEWIYTGDRVKVDNVRVIREIKLHKNLEYQLSIAGKIVPEIIIPITLSKTNCLREILSSLFNYCSNLRLCTGFEVSTQKQTYSLDGIVKGKPREWSFQGSDGSWVESIRHQAHLLNTKSYATNVQ